MEKIIKFEFSFDWCGDVNLFLLSKCACVCLFVYEGKTLKKFYLKCQKKNIDSRERGEEDDGKEENLFNRFSLFCSCSKSVITSTTCK